MRVVVRLLVAGLTLTALVLVPTAAGAVATTFAGSCTATGAAVSSPPIGLIPSPGTYSAVGIGTCSGRLNGQRIVAAPIHITLTMIDYLHSCIGGYGTARVDVAFDGGEHLVVAQTGTGGLMVASGAGGGTGIAMFTAYTQIAAQSPDLSQRCLTQSLVDWRYQWALVTLSAMRS